MERILIIEDEKDVNQLLAKTLEDSGYETASAYNGTDGLSFLEKTHFDMVLLDLLTMGADDYITKPFDLGEMSARVATNLRRFHKKETKKQITYKELVMDMEAKSITLNGIDLELTAIEYQMLELFLQFPNKVFSKANLYETIWGEEYLGDDNVIKTHISNLRSKMKKVNAQTEYIETVWGLGYRLAR